MIPFLLAMLAVWIYLVVVLKRAKLTFFTFLVGSVGLFIFMMILLQPLITSPLSMAVAAATGVIGKVTGMFHAYPQYSLVFIEQGRESISLYIDYECSGVIELLAFTALIWFFPLYNTLEKLMINITGLIWIFAANIVRLTVISVMVYFFGNNIFFFAHAIFGRIVFYGLSILLYFYVFTRSQIIKQKVGKFKYGVLTSENS